MKHYDVAWVTEFEEATANGDLLRTDVLVRHSTAEKLAYRIIRVEIDDHGRETFWTVEGLSAR